MCNRIEWIVILRVLKHILKISSKNIAHSLPKLMRLTFILEIVEAEYCLLCEIIYVDEIVREIVQKLVEITCCSKIDLEGYPVFKATEVARVDDGVY